MYFIYGNKEKEYLKSKDKKLGEAIEIIGDIKRELDPDLFSSVVHHIVGQQISTAGQRTIWARLLELLGEVNAVTISNVELQKLQKCGISFRKAEYIKGFAESVVSGEINLEELPQKTDDEIIKILSSIKGIGVWTAEMLMTFCLSRPDVLSYGDLAILRGMRMLYRHRKITPTLFNKYKKRYSPYGTTAALYFWAIAGGKIEGLSDPAPKLTKKPIKK